MTGTWTQHRFAAVGAGVIAIAVSQAAFAQDAAPAPQAAPAQSEESGTNDIVVTAQRRAQRLQDVGIAVTALGSEQIERANITNSQDIGRLVPSLKVASFSSAGTVFNIRGVSQNDYGDQQEPPVAVYQDDAYASSITLAGFPVFDTARVEALRGPQGTLFGRNATGGAVQFISKEPDDEFGGYAKVTAGSYGALTLEGAASAPLSDTLGIRIAGQRNTGGDYLKATQPGVPDLGSQNNFALRGIVKWTPTDNFSARLNLRYLRADHERVAGLYSHEVACPNASFQGEYLDPNTTCSFFAGFGNPGPGTTATGFRDDSINPQRGGDPWKTAYTTPSFTDRKFFGSTLRLEAQLGDVDLVSITDYQHATKLYSEDIDVSPDDVAVYLAGMNLDQVTQELRLSGKAGRHQWVIGAFGMYINGRYTATYSQPIFAYEPDVSFRQKTKSYAFFAQDEYELTPELKLIGGIRYWHDQRKGSYRGIEAGSGVDISFSKSGIIFRQNGVQQPVTGLAITADDANKGFSGFSARAEIDYQPSRDLLLYLAFNRGTKSGGFTFSAATPFTDPAGDPSFAVVANFFNNIPFKPETLDSYEAGVKATLGNGATLNIAAFHYNYRNYQAFAQVGLLQSILNVDAKVNGVEAELAVEPLAGLTFSANASYLDTKVKNVPIQDGSLRDRSLPQTPSLSGSATARYAFALAEGTASVQGDVQFTSKFCHTILCSPVDREPGYAVVNGRIGYDIGRVGLAVFVNNLFEKKYRVGAVDNALAGGFVASIYGKPRTFGVSATVRFGGEE